jgi:transcriptional regulator with XRE-family HTH domain
MIIPALMVFKFGDNVKKIRVEKSISQQELADIVGIHSTHVSRYERNMAQPSVEIAKKMAEALNVTVDTLIYGQQDEKSKNNLKDADLLNLFTKVRLLDKQDLTAVKFMLKAYIFQKDTKARLAQ